LNLNVEGVLSYIDSSFGDSPPPPHSTPNLFSWLGKRDKPSSFGDFGGGRGDGMGGGERDMECLSWEMHLVFGRNKIT